MEEVGGRKEKEKWHNYILSFKINSSIILIFTLISISGDERHSQSHTHCKLERSKRKEKKKKQFSVRKKNRYRNSCNKYVSKVSVGVTQSQPTQGVDASSEKLLWPNICGLVSWSKGCPSHYCFFPSMACLWAKLCHPKASIEVLILRLCSCVDTRPLQK